MAIKTTYNITTSKIKELFEKQKQLIDDAIALKPEEPIKSYAEVLSHPKKENKKLKHIIAIHSNNDTVKSFELKKKIKETIDPVVYGLGINNMKNIANGGVLIECEKESDIFKLKKVMKEQVEEIKTSIPKKKNPKLIIKNIDASVSNKEIVDYIFKQNFQNQNAETLKDDVKVLFCKRNSKTIQNML